MARPTWKRRLRDIDPEAFGKDLAARVEAHLILFLGQDATVMSLIRRHVQSIVEEATLLAQYARGASLDVERASDALLLLHLWFYSCAAHSVQPTTVRQIPIRAANDDLDVVLVAAHARIRLSREEPVHVHELACLAGVDSDHVRLLARQGEIDIVNGTVAPASAAQWLTSRGVLTTAVP